MERVQVKRRRRGIEEKTSEKNKQSKKII